jgi:mRNA-degrading endonuclease YafQ of YafQ-DinJ toxin-antitoxin module
VRQIVQTARFKKDLKSVALSGRHQASELFDIVAKLAKDEPLDAR